MWCVAVWGGFARPAHAEAPATECAEPVGALPDAEGERYALAEKLLGDGDAESASDYVELMLLKSGESVAVWELAARVFAALDDEERHTEARQRLEELCPGQSFKAPSTQATGPLADARNAYHAFLAAKSAKARDKSLKAALKAYTSLAKSADHAVEAHRALGVLRVYAGDPKGARRAYRWLRDHDALDASDVDDYARVLRTLSDQSPGGALVQEVGGLMDAWLDKLPGAERATAARHAGFVLLRGQRHAGAAEYFEAALAADGQDVESHFGLAMSLDGRAAQTGDRSKATALREKALAHAKRAVSHARFGDAARALVKRLEFDS